VSRSASLVVGEDIRLGRSGVRGRIPLCPVSHLDPAKGIVRHASIEFCVVIDHEHDFPLKDIVVHQSTADPWYVLVVLHLF
jgi:hypothetical protein